VLAQELKVALEAAQAIEDEERRAGELNSLASRLATVSRKALYPLWCQFLRRSAQQTRPHFLTDLAAFAPLLPALGGSEVAAQIVAAIQTVSQWWP